MSLFKIDDKEIEQYERDLLKFTKSALPIATGRVLADTAFIAQRFAKQDVNKNFINRNKHTLKSIIVDKRDTRIKDIDKQSASTGSTEQYMHDQEFGLTRQSKGKHGVPIPTSTASNEGDRAVPKRRLPTRVNRLKNVRLGSKRIPAKSRKQHNVALVREAAANKDKYVYLHTQKRKGIYKVTGGKRRPKIKMIWDLTNKTTTIPASPWLFPASLEALELQPSLYRKRMIEQLKFNNLFD